MKVILDDDAYAWLESVLAEWQGIADDYYKHIPEFENWKRSPILRENRRESVVYGNCRSTIHTLLRQTKQWQDKRREARKAAAPPESPK